MGWGFFLSALGAAIPKRVLPRGRATLSLLAALLLLLVLDLASPLVSQAPWQLSLPAAGVIAGACVALVVGASARRVGLAAPAFRALCIALMVAGIGNSLVAIVQVFAPDFADGIWIAQPSYGGRATGNLRQPNNLAGLLLWSIVVAVWLKERAAIRAYVAASLVGLFLFVIVLTGSRTGALATMSFVLWGLFDRRLTARVRIGLMSLPILYAFCLAAMALLTQAAFVSATPYAGTGVMTTNRYSMWLDALSLIRSHPWLGVGFGGFNFAWTLTPTIHRAPEGFDHAHNLLLQLAVEIGIPFTLLIAALVAFAAYRAWLDARARPNDDDSSITRACLIMIVLIGFHSLLEYPLWYVSGLLTTAFLAGLCLEHVVTREAKEVQDPDSNAARPLVLVSAAMVLGAVFVYADYQRVAKIYVPTSDEKQLSQRISAGRESPLFGHFADYVAATESEDPATVMSAFPAATHHLLDPKLMMAWVRALSEQGDNDRARYVARRLEEFQLDETKDFFAPCSATTVITSSAKLAARSLPYQCGQPSRFLRYEDLQ